MKHVLTCIAALAGLMLAGCAQEKPATTLANPAAVFCTEQGGTFEIRQDSDGAQSGVCILANGKETDAWTFFRENAPV